MQVCSNASAKYEERTVIFEVTLDKVLKNIVNSTAMVVKTKFFFANGYFIQNIHHWGLKIVKTVSEGVSVTEVDTLKLRELPIEILVTCHSTNP